MFKMFYFHIFDGLVQKKRKRSKIEMLLTSQLKLKKRGKGEEKRNGLRGEKEIMPKYM